MLAQKLIPQEELKYKLLGSFLDFTRYFYKFDYQRLGFASDT